MRVADLERFGVSEQQSLTAAGVQARPRLRLQARSVQARFFLACIAAASLVLALFVVIVDLLDRQAVSTELNRKLERVAANHSILLVDAVSRNDMKQMELVLASAISDPDIVHIALIDPTGNDLARLGRSAEGTGTVVTERPIRIGDAGEIVTAAYLILEMTDAHLASAAQERLLLSTVVGVVLLATLLCVSFYIHRRFIGRPIRDLKGVIDATERGVGDARVDWRSDDDIGAVVNAFNSMRDRQSAFEHALQEAHATLEQRVQQRTSDLVAARDEAEAANRAKGAFLASMSHELRTPLNAIIGFAQLMQLRPYGGDQEKQQEYLDHILSSGEHLLTLINDLLDLSKIEAGHAELFETDVPIADLLETVIDMMKPLAQKQGVSVTTHGISNDVVLYADAQKVRQIVLNLLSNAIKFTRAGGRIDISAEVDRWGKLVISVSDTGIGIEREDLERIMEPFEQVRSPEQHELEGTGLGLPLASGMAKLHDGKMRLTSKPGRGTKATVTFPARRVKVTRP